VYRNWGSCDGSVVIMKIVNWPCLFSFLLHFDNCIRSKEMSVPFCGGCCTFLLLHVGSETGAENDGRVRERREGGAEWNNEKRTGGGEKAFARICP